MALDWSSEDYTGSDCTGSDGDSNRVLTISNSGRTNNNGFLVKVGELWLKNNEEFTISHKTSSSEITFLNGMWDDMEIEVKYYVRAWGDPFVNWKNEELSGSDANGASGDSNRVLTLNNSNITSICGFFVAASGLKLTLDEDYEVEHNGSGSTVTFFNPLWDDMTIVVKYYEKPDKHVSEYSKVRDDFQEIVLEHGINATLKRQTETTDSNGGVTEISEEYYNLFVMVQDITNKDRQLHDMGVIQTGSSKVFFFHEYPDSVTDNGDLTVQTGDILTIDDTEYIIDQLLSKRTFQGEVIFIPTIIKKVDLD